MSVTLGAVLDRLRAESLITGIPDELETALQVDAITTDSRFVRPGTLFCAVRGAAGDGHDFLAAAADSGAVATLVELEAPGVSVPQIRVGSTRRAAAFAAAELYDDPWNGITLIGVTGTNGKTTTVEVLRHLLARSGRAASMGTLGLIGPDGRRLPGAANLTTPGPAQFAEEMRRLVDDGVQAVAMEVSSHALAQERVAAARFSAAIYTNLSRDHLDYHGTFEEYRAAKLKLLGLIGSGGVAAANVDDPAWATISRDGVHIIRFGTQGRGEVQAENIRYGADGADWHLHTPSCTSPVHLPLFGPFNVYNALGAAAALWGLGWRAEQIAEGLAIVGQVPGRLERIPGVAGPTILIDYAHTPDALERALQALRPFVEGRLIVVFGAGGDRDRGKRPEMGRVAAENADLSIVTSDNPRHEDPVAIAAQIEAGMGDAPRLRILDRREAIARALELATPSDLVLLAGKGHETYQVWGDEHRPFDERLVVAELLEQGIGR
ncbi:MAG TPA: UDP-N-acetylmuramoyl-L-alanyl-D-glutamate--2,6-diaminopimelate ligase [Longimicrobiaceae bacterium]|nr:UDP-N-acetylmuramoyl-L-alanyl-D-glutamate--2,6-diaminopimelate ligase [Longimicrobiaceae bacterium]